MNTEMCVLDCEIKARYERSFIFWAQEATEEWRRRRQRRMFLVTYPRECWVECIDHNQRLYCFAENTDNNISSHSKVSYFNWPFQTLDEYYLEMVITATIQTTPSPVPKPFGGAEWGISTIFMLDIIIKRFNKGSPKIDQGVIASFSQRWSTILL